MKKKLSICPIDFIMPHLYKDDLLQIEDLIKALEPRYFKIETDTEADLKSISEISDRHPKNLIFSASQPSFSLHFDERSAYLYADEDSNLACGVALKIGKIITKRERPILKKYLNSGFKAFIPMIFFLLVLSPLEENFTKRMLKIILGIILGVSIYAFSSMLLSYPGLIAFSKIEMSNYRERQNFFMKNKDQLLTNLIVGIIVSFVTAILTLAFTKKNGT